MELLIAFVLLTGAAFLGNVVGYEIGRAIGPPLYERDGRLLKKKYFDQTHAFFDKHGNKALVIGRFVPFVRTYITVVAGVTADGPPPVLPVELRSARCSGWAASCCSATSWAGRSRAWARTSTWRSWPSSRSPWSRSPWEWWRHQRQRSRRRAEADRAPAESSSDA